MRIIGVIALASLVAGLILLGRRKAGASGLQAGAALTKTGALLVVAIRGNYMGWLIALWAELIKRKVCSTLFYLVSFLVIRR